MSTALRETVETNPVWYHTIELAPGVVTPGWFDLRPVVHKLPWPDVRGKRCLDIGTYDGFLAFEMERRGAAEVVALDIPDHRDWDWPADTRKLGPAYLASIAGPKKGVGFQIARDALGSRVEKVDMSVYELGPDRLGSFDVVVCGSLLLHLRDPMRALAAMKSVCSGWLMSSEEVDLRLSVTHPRRPLVRLDGTGAKMQWWVPNVAGHRRMIYAAGFEVVRANRPYSDAFGVGHPLPDGGGRRLLRRLLTGGDGVPHAAVLARPRV